MNKRVPLLHVETIKKVSLGAGPLPRFALATLLCKEIESISFSTALEYVLYARKENILKKKGMQYYVDTHESQSNDGN